MGDPESKFSKIAEIATKKVKNMKDKGQIAGEQEMLQTVLEKIPCPVCFKNEEGQYTQVSKSMAEHLNADRESVIGKTEFDFYPEDQAEELIGDDRVVMEEEEPIANKEMKITTPEGRDEWISVTKFPRHDSSGKVIGTLGIYRNVTELKQVREELEAGKKQAIFLAEKSGNLMYRLDKNKQCLYANTKTLSYIGRDREEVIGSKFTEFLSEENARDLIEALDEVFETGESVELRHKWDNPERWFDSTLNPIPDPETGEVANVLVTSKDITKQHEAEEKGEFLNSLIRHDLRYKNQVIQGYLQILEEMELSGEEEEFLQKAIKATRRSYDLIEELRTLKETEREERLREVNVGLVLSKVVEENEERAEREGIEMDYDRIEAYVEAGSFLRELFTNLVVNSIQHSGGDRIKIRIQVQEDCVRIRVEDNGRGIPEKNESKIFERSFAGKDSRGSGLGLHLVKKIAESYGGNVELKDSELGGARFDVTLRKP